MTVRKPLVIVDGQIGQLADTDSIEGMTLPQPLDTTDAPTFAGGTLNGHAEINSQGYAITSAPLTHGGTDYAFNIATGALDGAGVLNDKEAFDFTFVSPAQEPKITKSPDGVEDLAVALISIVFTDPDTSATVTLPLTVYFPNSFFIGGTNPSPGTDDSDYVDTWLLPVLEDPTATITVDYYRESIWTANGAENAYTWANPDSKSLATGYTSPPTLEYLTAKVLDVTGNVTTADTLNILNPLQYEGHDILIADYVKNNFFFAGGGNKGLTGELNFCMAQAAGQRLTTGSWNTFIGALAGAKTTEGSYNFALGKMALFDNLTGGNCIAIGDSAGLSQTSGVGNIYIGDYSGRGNLTGNANVCLGRTSGYSALGSNNVFLGSEAGYYETGGDKLFIDNQKRDNEAGSKTKALIYGQFHSTAANQKLYVNGELYEYSNRVLTDQADCADISSSDISAWDGKQDALTGSISGTTNQISVSSNSNSVAENISLELPQDIDTAAAVNFGTLQLGSTAIAAHQSLAVTKSYSLAANNTSSMNANELTLNTIMGTYQNTSAIRGMGITHHVSGKSDNATNAGTFHALNATVDLTSGYATNLRGLEFSAINSGNNNIAGNIIGSIGAASNTGTGTITTAIGLYGYCRNSNAGGTITSAISIYAPNAIKTAGTITAAYGLFIDNITAGTNNYSIYSGTAPSYLGGNVGIKTAAPSSALDITGDVEIDASSAYYMGDPSTDGSWRIIRSGNNLLMQRRVSGTWTTKQTITG